MADPLSMTLAVITLATAVKDMVELGQKIHESFAKVSKNLRKAQDVAKRIHERLKKLQAFYVNHQEALDNMESFRVDLLGLLGKFQDFEESILPLLPKTGGKKLGLFIQGWWNNNRIEGRILDLQSDIVQLMLEYMMDSAMRGEVKMDAVHQETVRGLEILEVVQRDVSAISIRTGATTMIHSSYQSSGSASDELTSNIIMFAQSTPSSSLPMLRTPNVITEEIMTTAYIKLEIDGIAKIVEKINTLPVSAPSLGNPGPFKLTSLLEHAGSMGITHLRHHVVRQVTGVRDFLETDRIQTVSIHDSAEALGRLSSALETLGMGDESKLVGKWAIVLARTLFNASGGVQLSFGGDLALHLLNQSKRYGQSGDEIQSLQAVDEAHRITRNLRNQYGGEADLQILYSDILLQYANLVDNQQSIKMCIEAVQVLEDILHVQAYTQSTSPEPIRNVVHHSSSTFLDAIFSSAPSRLAISAYASALHKLGGYLSIDDHSESALDLQLLAIAVHRKLVSIYGHEYRMYLARALSLLVQGGTARGIPAEELVGMAEECLQLYRELAEKNPVWFARSLVLVLMTKVETLESLNRNAEAITTWEEVASLGGQILQDSRVYAFAQHHLSRQFACLERYDDAVRTGTLAVTTYKEPPELQAMRYHILATNLRQLRRYKESADAAQRKIALYRHLAMKDPATWMAVLTEGLSSWSHCLAASGDYSAALVAWKESVSMLDNFLNANPDKCLSSLGIHRLISYVLKDEEDCIMVNVTAVQFLYRLRDAYPQNINIIQTLLDTEFSYVYNMLRAGLLQDAQQYIDQWFDLWNIVLAQVDPRFTIILRHVAMSILEANALDAQGCTEQALLVTQKIQEIMEQHFSIYHPSSLELTMSMAREAQLHVSLGHSEEASQVAAKLLQRSRGNMPEPLIAHLLWSLHGVAFTALSCHNYNHAAEAAQEGCTLLTSPEGLKFGQSEHHAFIRPSLFAMLSSAEANLGRLSTALEYAHRAVEESLNIRDNKLEVSATTAEWSYVETRGNLAEILLATGDLNQARQICEERTDYFFRRVDKRNGEYRELAPILRMLGILCCSEGLHEDGEAAAEELSRILGMLGSAFPSLQGQVKIRLRNQAKVPILKVLEDLSKKLDCGHQAEIVSLFVD